MTTAVEETPVTTDGAPEKPLHFAKCSQCDVAIQFRVISPNAFLIHEKFGTSSDIYGVGPNGYPLCPNEHGELVLADEQLPVGEAFELAADRLHGAQQASLPGIVPPFNYQGAFEELVSKAKEVERLKADYEEDKARASESKKAWEKAAELLTKMGVDLDRRRREKAAAGEAIADLDPTRCTFEHLNPDKDCPLCDHSIVDIEDMAIAPKNSAEHAQQAAAMLLTRAVVGSPGTELEFAL